MSPEEKAFSDALEVYEKLLNSETQAIVAVDLDKLEAILKSKDEALRSVLESRDALDDDPRENSTFSKILDCIIDIQGRNAQTLENLLKELEVGKKGEFMLQEILREVNTLSSKSNNTLISRIAVDFKNELEKMREQLLNLE